MCYIQIFHNLKNTTKNEVFKKIVVGSIVTFNFKADPNYGHLSGKKYTMLCTVKFEWNNGHHKYNFLPIEKKSGVLHKGVLNASNFEIWNYKKTDIANVIPIADDKTGELFTCEIKDYGYVSLEVRSNLFEKYYHKTNNSEVEINFELTNEETLDQKECERIRHSYGDLKSK